MARHIDHLSVSLRPKGGDTSLEARFDAARYVTCLAAVFAKLPTCLGVYFPNADLILSPDRWVNAADTALRGEVPATEWMAIIIERHPEPQPLDRFSVSSIGLAVSTVMNLSCQTPTFHLQTPRIGLR